jgi:Domain of unknown function (DUF4082)
LTAGDDQAGVVCDMKKALLIMAALALPVVLGCIRPAPAQQPLTIFGNGAPQIPVDPDTNAVTLGVKFWSTQAGTINGIRFYRGRSNSNGYTVKLFSASGSLLGSNKVSQDTCAVPCWEAVNFGSPIPISQNTTYVAAYYTSNGRYAGDNGGLTNGVQNGPLTAPASSQAGGNGVYTYSTGFPNRTYQDSNYWVDVLFVPNAPALSLAFSPPNPSLPDNSSVDTLIATAVATWSDGSQFTGAYGLVNSDNGICALSGSQVFLGVSFPPGNSNQTCVASATEGSSTVQSNLPIVVTSTQGGGPLLPPDRDASANWRMAGMLSQGGIPSRSTVCQTVNPIGDGADDTPNINAAIAACPAGNIVSLSPGTFTISEGSIVRVNKAVTVRGAGPTATHLVRTNGAQLGSYFPGSNQSELIRISGSPASGSVVALTADVAQGSSTVQAANAAEFSVGEIVLLDEASGSGWQTDRVNPSTEQILASPDYRVVWNIHNPSMGGDDNTSVQCYFQINCDHPTNEMHQISAISGNTISFDSPVTISYRVNHGAQLTPMLAGPTNAGVEELSTQGGDNGNIRFEQAAYSWVKNVESSLWLNEGFAIDSSFRVQLEGIYIHDAVWPVPGGGGYAISFAFGSSEALIENSISLRANKVMVARSSGTGSVIAYNYMDDGFIYGQDSWVEIGLNASHLAGSHHVLFEGNYGFNIDSDQTHGNSIYHTFFRNYVSGYRRGFTDYLNSVVVGDINNRPGGNGPLRAGGAHAYAYWFSFLGNVLGTAGHTSGWTYDCIGAANFIPSSCIWLLGWVDISPQGYDPNTAATAIRNGNYDYLSNTVTWAPSDTAHTLPNSLYLSQEPAFFQAGSGYAWPWVNPTGSPQFSTLPAKARYDAGTPFSQP